MADKKDGDNGNDDGAPTPPGNDPPKDDKDSKGDDGGSGGAGDGGGSGGKQDDETEKLRKIIREEIAALSGGAGTQRVAPRRADLEAEAERMVREASEALEAKKAHDAEHEKMRQTKPEDRSEKPPVKLRRLTKGLWGSEE